MAEEVRDSFLDKRGIRTLWTAIQTLLAQKADWDDLDELTSQEDVAVAIAAALTDYLKKDLAAETYVSKTEASDEYLSKSEAKETYSTTEYVASEIAKALANDGGLSFEIVEYLPESGKKGVIYLVSKDSSDGGNDIYDEYIWVNDKFEHLGSTSIDLSGYWNQDNLTAISDEELEEILT